MSQMVNKIQAHLGIKLCFSNMKQRRHWVTLDWDWPLQNHIIGNVLKVWQHCI